MTIKAKVNTPVSWCEIFSVRSRRCYAIRRQSSDAFRGCASAGSAGYFVGHFTSRNCSERFKLWIHTCKQTQKEVG